MLAKIPVLVGPGIAVEFEVVKDRLVIVPVGPAFVVKLDSVKGTGFVPVSDPDVAVVAPWDTLLVVAEDAIELVPLDVAAGTEVEEVELDGLVLISELNSDIAVLVSDSNGLADELIEPVTDDVIFDTEKDEVMVGMAEEIGLGPVTVGPAPNDELETGNGGILCEKQDVGSLQMVELVTEIVLLLSDAGCPPGIPVVPGLAVVFDTENEDVTI